MPARTSSYCAFSTLRLPSAPVKLSTHSRFSRLLRQSFVSVIFFSASSQVRHLGGGHAFGSDDSAQAIHVHFHALLRERRRLRERTAEPLRGCDGDDPDPPVSRVRDEIRHGRSHEIDMTAEQRRERVTRAAPPAPALFSTLRGPSTSLFSCSTRCTRRATLSEPPPAAEGAMSSSGREGFHACACAPHGSVAMTTGPNVMRNRVARDVREDCRRSRAWLVRRSVRMYGEAVRSMKGLRSVDKSERARVNTLNGTGSAQVYSTPNFEISRETMT